MLCVYCIELHSSLWRWPDKVHWIYGLSNGELTTQWGSCPASFTYVVNHDAFNFLSFLLLCPTGQLSIFCTQLNHWSVKSRPWAELGRSSVSSVSWHLRRDLGERSGTCEPERRGYFGGPLFWISTCPNFSFLSSKIFRSPKHSFDGKFEPNSIKTSKVSRNPEEQARLWR